MHLLTYSDNLRIGIDTIGIYTVAKKSLHFSIRLPPIFRLF